MRAPAIALVGFMGSGKSTVGPALAERMGRRFVDLDEELARRTELSVPEWFAQRGETAFREAEAGLLAELSSDEGLVIGCGGGVVTTEAGRSSLKPTLVIYLAADEEAILARLTRSSGGQGPVQDRPLLAGLEAEALRERVHELLAVRRPLYAEVSAFAVDATAPVSQAVKRIVRELEAYGYDGHG